MSISQLLPSDGIFVFGINLFAEILMRNILRIALRSMRSKGYNQKHLLLVGYSRAAEGFIDRVNVNPEWGYKIRGILDDHEEWGKEYKGVRVIGKLTIWIRFWRSIRWMRSRSP